MNNTYNLWSLPLLFTLCIFTPPPAAGADSSAEAEKARQEFQSRCPKPVWWDRIPVPDVRIDTYDDLLGYWQSKDRTKSEFFKAAYQAILDYPLDEDIVATAVNLMNGTASYRFAVELQEYGLEKHFTYNHPYGKPGDNTAGIVENLATRYNNSSQYDRSVRLIERVLTARAHEINDHLLELLHINYAAALHGQNRTDKAISILKDAISRYNGSWEQRLQSDLSKYERILSSATRVETTPQTAVTGQRDGSGDEQILSNPAGVKTTPLIDRPNTFKPWWDNNSEVVYTALIVFFLLLIIINILKGRTEQRPSRRV